MPSSGYYDTVFASSGTTTVVPDPVQGDGSVSYTQGYGPNYTLINTASGYLPVDQPKFNRLFYDMTSAMQLVQQNGCSNFITSAMNGGTSYSYNQGATVLYSGVVYVSLVSSNTDTPPSSKWAVLGSNPAVSPVIGSTAGLKGVWASNTTATFVATQIIVQNSSNVAALLTSYNNTLNTATAGAGGLDTGSLAASTWYAVYAIYGATGTSILFSTSSTSPTLPSGYTYYGRIGWVLTDGSKNLIGFHQNKGIWSYTVGSNLSSIPVVTSGVLGNVSTPVYVTTSVTSFVAPTAIQIGLNLYTVSTGEMIVSPNGSWGAYNTASGSNIPFVQLGLGSGSQYWTGTMPLESLNIYVASAANSSNSVACYGFIDNL